MTIQKNAIGFVFEFTIKEDGVALPIDDATVKKIILRPLGGSAAVKDAQFKTTGADGILSYTTVAGDLSDPATKWQAQAYVETPEFEGYSEIVDFTVRDNLATIE